MIKKFLYCLLALFVVAITTSCAAKAFEVELNVVFMVEDEIIGYDTVTQFKNIKSPELSEAYIPDGYKLFGWTALNPDSIRGDDPKIDEKYIGNGAMVHYDDVDEFANNTTVILTTGTYLKANILIGSKSTPEGPHGEERSNYLSDKKSLDIFLVTAVSTAITKAVTENCPLISKFASLSTKISTMSLFPCSTAFVKAVLKPSS